MRRLTIKIGVLAATMALALAAAENAQGVPTQHTAHRGKAPTAYFEMTDVTGQRFVIALTDPAKIRHARDLVNGTSDSEPHVVGRIDKRRVAYNPRWSYHIKPDTIDFFDYAIEVCDATIPYVEDHLREAGGAFLPGLIWCPWSSRLVREIPAE
ncbi:BP74-related protein [Streptomyces halobius]|uniref:Calmodulin-binding protein n=1 Tax=Streptomyces halobius TaxID=2879846 RepID=A0ABY4MAQ7_9ACTN|nr:calmodulin-binding protein [Streptomyces halobius]UQA94503.1 calmodulin-binding protein [Streptomyces halobius]